MGPLASFIVITGIIGAIGLFLFLINVLEGISSYYKEYSELPSENFDLTGLSRELQKKIFEFLSLQVIFSKNPKKGP